MTTTQTTNANSFSSDFTTLSAEGQPRPTQQFRVGTDGPIIPVEAEWDKQLQQFCFRVDELQNHLGVKVDHVKRAESGVFVNRLRDRSDEICVPHRYAVSSGILEVYTNTGPPRPSSTNNAYQSSGIINQFDRLHLQFDTASRKKQQTDTAEYLAGLQQHYPALIHCQNDAANIIAVKTNELILYPVPRRFFVILRNRNRFFKHLQLHLLCECGIYDDDLDSALEESIALSEVDSAFEATNDDDPVGPTRTHLSNHAGYKIKEPTKLCKDLGSHLLPVLKFLHYSAVFAGIVVPALASIDVSGWFTVAQSFVNYNNQSWSEPWLKTIDYVAGLCELQVHLKEDEVELTKDDIPRAIQYPEYRQYQIHLQELDPRKAYGNLIPIFCNRTGRLKYVCSDHDDDPMRTEDNPFGRLETLGRTDVQDGVQTAPGIRKVNIELVPGTTAAELNTLRKNLTKANIDNIGLSVTSITAPGSSYNEVLKLMTNHRCQSLSLVGFREFYSKISGTKNPAATRLKSLTLLCDYYTSQWEKLRMILKLCPGLRTLTIRTDYSDQLCYNIRSELPHLKRLDFFGSTHTTIIRTTKDSHGKTGYTIELNATAPPYLPSLPNEICSHLVILRLQLDPKGSLKLWLVETLRNCPRLLTFDLRVPLKHFLTLVTLLKDELRAVNTLHGTPDSRRIVRLRSAEDDHDVTMTIKFQEHAPEFNINVEMTGTKESNPPLESLFRSYGSSIRSLVANHFFDDTLAEAMIKSFYDRDSKLELLTIDPAGLTDILRLLTIMDRSPDLNEFTLSFSFLEDSTRQDLAETYLDRYSDRATGLLLRGGGRRSDWITKAIPTRSRLTEILHFEISFDEGRGRLHGEPEIRSVLQFISPPSGSAMGIPHLQSISFSSCDLTPEQWSRILINLDLRALRYLSVEDTNFGAEEMDLLIGRLPKPTATPRLIQESLAMPLDELVIKNTTLVKDMQILARLETKLLLQAPNIKVIID
ncbi:hypothetical protein BGZ90_006622 [Linnemannia elongata]|nr:hypothetical protein BGZ90_006622 [Linnemannia elongata]